MTVFAALLLMTAVQAQSDEAFEAVPSGLGQRLASQYAVPATAAFASQAAQLAQGIDGLCANTTAAAAVRQQFADTVAAWSRVEFLRFGPLVEANRYERIMFWPDPRGATTRQVQALLASAELPRLTPEQLASQSVATNGLPALEFVLYRDGGLLAGSSADAGAFQAQCQFARAASGALRATAEQLAQAWSAQGSFGPVFGQPSPINSTYRSQQEVAAEAIKALAMGLQFAGEIKLAPIAKDQPWQDADLRRTPLWRSGLALLAVREGVGGMRQFYATAEFRFEDEEQWRDTQLRETFARLQAALEAEPDALAAAMQQPETGKPALLAIKHELHVARDQLSGIVAPYLGISIGFNALDGD